MTRMVLVLIVSFWCCFASCRELSKYPVVKSIDRTVIVPSIASADVSLDINSVDDIPVYRLQCHTAGYKGDSDFDYSGDFECRLNSIVKRDAYSTLLTENANQDRDWESRGRFFGASLREPCASIPNFGSVRNFRLRGMSLTLKITNAAFSSRGKLNSVTLEIIVSPDLSATREITQIVPLPTSPLANDCDIKKYFYDSSKEGKRGQVLNYQFFAEMGSGLDLIH